MLELPAMPDKFNMHAAPFDRLSLQEQESLRSSLDVAYYRKNEVILKPGQQNTSLHILIKGAVEERSGDDEEIFAHYANDDLFDVRSQLEGNVKHKYVALEDTLSYLLPKSVFTQLYQTNDQFAAYFDSNLSKRQALLEAAQKQQNLGEFILTKVDDSIYHPVLVLSPDEPLNAVTRLMKEQSIDSALVQLNQEDPRLDAKPSPYPYGIITRTNMLHAVMLDGCALNTPVGDIATYPVFYVEEDDFLFNAMITMTRNRMKRVMVCNGEQPVGMLDMTQILSSFSTHSHVLSLSIARAQSIDELAIAANRQRNLVESLISNGIRTRFVMELISAVNEQIIEKAFHLVVPEERHEQCCLIVLGSEGRGEQVLKTDQDNALLIKDDVEWPDSQRTMDKLTHTLQQLGYPPCPGNVMVNNPEWVNSQSGWQQVISQWIKKGTPEHVMKLAIMADAHAVAGNRELLTPIATHISQTMKNNMLVLLDFTRPALQFSLPLTLFGNVKKSKDGLDIKRGGIFPIVHGIRALTLEYALEEKNTFDRIEALQRKKILEPDTADNLSEALKLFFKLRLSQQLSEHHSGNNIELQLLDRSERDLLRHSLHVVKKFKQWLGYHYQIRD
ncbi:putative signal-transduction protein containing cAMP-binding and CBS domains [Vibrio nigripulchritudo SFn118]|nr:putative signal-transduction protein containing cAMP-binding and CBS domains [Vibrio nigripulchritudo SFn118]